jgi:hypothetical protein
MPPNPTPGMVRVAADIALLMGLRLVVGDDSPLPYATGFAAERMGWQHKAQASREIHRLVDAGVIDCLGELKPLGKGNGTKTYAPPASMPPLACYLPRYQPSTNGDEVLSGEDLVQVILAEFGGSVDEGWVA